MINDDSYLLHCTDIDGVGSKVSVFSIWFGLSKFVRFGSRVYEKH